MDVTGQPSVQSLQPVAAPRRGRMEFSLATSALWLVAAKTVAAAINIVVPLLLVRLLTVREFGVYKQLFLLLDTSVVILTLGFALSAFYFFPREPGRKVQVVGNIALVYVLVGGLGGLLVAKFPALPVAVLNTPDLAAYAPTIGIAMMLWVSSSFIEFVAIANGEVRIAGVIVLVTQLLRSLVLLAAAAFFGSIRALANTAVIHGCLQSAVVLWYVRTRFSGTRWGIDWRLLRAQLAYAVPLQYAALLWWLQGFVHHYFVSVQFGAAAYAVYAVGCFQLPIVAIAHDSVGSVVIRHVNELRRRNEPREIVRLATQTVRSLAAFSFPLYALLLVTGHEFITILFTERYHASWPIFAVNLSLIPLAIVAAVCDAVFRAYPEQLPFYLKVRTGLVVPLLGGLWIATRQLSLVGAVGVVVGVTFAERILLSARVARVLGMSWGDVSLFGDVAKLASAAGGAGIATFLTREVLLRNGLTAPLALLVISSAVFTLVCVGAVLLLRVLTPEECDAIRRWLAGLLQVVPAKRALDASQQGGA